MQELNCCSNLGASGHEDALFERDSRTKDRVSPFVHIVTSHCDAGASTVDHLVDYYNL